MRTSVKTNPESSAGAQRDKLNLSGTNDRASIPSAVVLTVSTTMKTASTRNMRTRTLFRDDRHLTKGI